MLREAITELIAEDILSNGDWREADVYDRLDNDLPSPSDVMAAISRLELARARREVQS